MQYAAGPRGTAQAQVCRIDPAAGGRMPLHVFLVILLHLLLTSLQLSQGYPSGAAACAKPGALISLSFTIIIDVRGIFIAVSDTRQSQRRPRTAAGGRVACARARFAWQRQRRVQSYGLAHRRVAWYNGAPLACARLFSCRHLRHLKHSRPEEYHGSCRKKSLTVLHIRAVHADYGYARGGRVHGFPAEGVGGEAFSAPHPSNYFLLQ